MVVAVKYNCSFFPLYSVGGSDYGSVRIGTYMGRKIIKSTAAGLSKGNKKDDMDKDGIELLDNEASLDYLCNLPPHRYHVTALSTYGHEYKRSAFYASFSSSWIPIIFALDMM